MRFEIFILVLSLANVFAQKPTPCSSPVQWEGHLYESDDNRGFRSSGNFSYDSTNQRTRFIEEIQDGRFDDVFDVLRLWGQKTEYRFDLRKKFCQKVPLNEPWSDLAVPANSTFIRTTSFGLKSGGLGVNVWSSRFRGPQGEVDYLGLWTPANCIPIEIHYRSQRDRESNVVRIEAFDITPGIADPSVFTPRPECK